MHPRPRTADIHPEADNEIDCNHDFSPAVRVVTHCLGYLKGTPSLYSAGAQTNVLVRRVQGYLFILLCLLHCKKYYDDRQPDHAFGRYQFPTLFNAST